MRVLYTIGAIFFLTIAALIVAAMVTSATAPSGVLIVFLVVGLCAWWGWKSGEPKQ